MFLSLKLYRTRFRRTKGLWAKTLWADRGKSRTTSEPAGWRPETASAKLRLIACWIALLLTAVGVATAESPDSGQRPAAEQSIKINARADAYSRSVVANYRFERPEDANFDGFPDRWTRHRDAQHPPYLPIKIAPHSPQWLDQTQTLDRAVLGPWELARKSLQALPPLPPASSDWLVNHYLRMELDGGAARMQSPPVAVATSYRYQLSGRTLTERLRHHSAHGELVFLDAAGNDLSVHAGPRISGTAGWQSWQSDLVSPPPGATHLAVRLRLAPTHREREQDIQGAAGFDDLRVVQVPRIRLETDQRFALYQPGQQPVIRMHVAGLPSGETSARFVLLDSDGGEIAGTTRRFEPAAAPSTLGQSTASQQVAGERVAQWQLPPLPPGFYVVRSGVIEADQEWLRAEATLAVLAELPLQAIESPFGWTLPHGVASHPVRSLPDWLQWSGVRVIKYPLWLDPDDRQAVDDAAWLTERLKDSEIRCIGLLADPPPAIAAVLNERDRRQPVAANWFREPGVWRPLLEPIMTRLTIRVPLWQLGHDGDQSFIGRPQLPEVIRDIQRGLQGYGQPIGVAISWPWLDPLPPQLSAVVAAVNHWTDQPPTAGELHSRLPRIDQSSAAAAIAGKQPLKQESWLSIDPLDQRDYDRDSRITDLMQRMGVVRSAAITGAFVSNPSDPHQGLFRPDWRPDELYLPWRTAACLLGDVVCVGSITAEPAANNLVFANDQRTLMMLWSDRPQTLELFLGPEIRQIDAWGRITVPAQVERNGLPHHRIELGRTPVFLTDLDPLIVKLRMTSGLASGRLDSLLGRRQTISLRVHNPSLQPLSGSIRLNAPPDWLVESPPQSIHLDAGHSGEVSFHVVLRNSVQIGPAPLQFQFALRSEPAGSFIMQRTITVGPAGLELETETKREHDRLLVRLTLHNHSEHDRHFDCLLFPPEQRQYQRRQVSIPAGTAVRREFVWEDGESLVGQSMLLRAVEQGGGHILNQSIPVTR